MKIKITGLPKFKLAGVTGGCAWDEYWDGTKCVKYKPFEQIFDVEGTVGGYNAETNSTYPLDANAGYNYKRGYYYEEDEKSKNYHKIIDARTGLPATNYTAPFNDLHKGEKPTYDQWYTLFNQEYGKDLEQYNEQIRTEAGDFLYNSGVDPRIYLLDQYIKQVEGNSAGLSGRGAFRKANRSGVWTDAAKEQEFNTLYSQYANKINALPPEQQRKLLNAGREFFYNNTNRGNIVNGKFVKSADGTGTVANPATLAWLQRFGMPNYAGRFKQKPEETTATGTNVTPSTTPSVQPTNTNPNVTSGNNVGTNNQPVVSTTPVVTSTPDVQPDPNANTTLFPDQTTTNGTITPPVVASTTPAAQDEEFPTISFKPSVYNDAQGIPADEIGPEDPDKVVNKPDNQIPGQRTTPVPLTGINPFPFHDKEIESYNKMNPVDQRKYDTGVLDAMKKNKDLGTREQLKNYKNWYNQKYPKQKRTPIDNSYGIATAGAMSTGLSFIGNTMQGIQEQQDLSDYNRKIGQTDASNPVVKNIYSRGRNVMNAPSGADYAPNMMTPVQFSGRPTPSFTGYPMFPYNMYAQDGLSVTEDILGLPTLYSMPSMYTDFDIPTESSSASTGEGSYTPDVSTKKFTSASGDFVLPVKNFRISSGFGHRAAPLKGASTEHNGVDLAVPENSSVFAPMDGVVTKIYSNSKGGNQLIVQHPDGSRSGYAHLNGYKVKVGDQVTRGQVIALSGNTGNSSGPHLHFTFRNPSGDLVDPVDYFNMRGTTKSRYETGISNWDHNNPGNIHIGDFARSYGATAGRKDGDGRVAIFPDMQTGLRAMQDLIFNPSYINLTISKARNRWVNGDEPNNFTSSSPYIVKALGGDFVLRDLNQAQRKTLVSEFIKWEDRNVYDKLKKQGYFQQGGTVSNNTNDMKIRITGTPGSKQFFADGGKTVGDQMGYGLYRGQSVRDFNAFNKTDEDNYDENINYTDSPVPREEANIEAEKGEKRISPDLLSITDILGKKHSGGGTPLKAEPGSYIVSDFITAPKDLQEMMGFNIESKKKRDNTWAKVLDSKVKSKDFNKLSQIIQSAAKGKEVDPFELAMAQTKLPVYQDYVSKAALGNELTKMMQGKQYEIPQIAMPAMMKMFPEMAQQMMGGGAPNPGGPEPNGVQEYPQGQEPMMRYGGLPQFIGGGPGDGDKKYTKKDIPELERQGYKRVPGTNTWRKSSSSSDSKPINITPGKAGVKGTTGKGTITYGDKISPSGGGRSSSSGPCANLTGTEEDMAARPKCYDSFLNKYGWKNATPEERQEGWKVWNGSYDRPSYTAGTVTPDIPEVKEVRECPTGYQPDPNDPNNCIKKTEKVDEVTIQDAPKGSGEPGFDYDYSGMNFPRIPYTQDILSVGNALANQYAYPTIGPLRGRYNPVYMDPAFISTEGVDRLIQSQGKTAMEDASLYAGSPQAQAARQAQVNAQMMPSLMQNRVQTNQQNIGSDMGTRQFNTQIANQAAMMDAQMTTQLAQDNATLAMNRAKERVLGADKTKNAISRMLTNSGDTALMNQWYPQYAFNPINYQTYFKGGYGWDDEGAGSSDKTFNDNLTAAKAYADSLGVTGKDRNDAIMDYLEFTTGKPSRKSNPYSRGSRVSPNFDDGDAATQSKSQDGGFIPMYYIGGWY